MSKFKVWCRNWTYDVILVFAETRSTIRGFLYVCEYIKCIKLIPSSISRSDLPKYTYHIDCTFKINPKYVSYEHDLLTILQQLSSSLGFGRVDVAMSVDFYAVLYLLLFAPTFFFYGSYLWEFNFARNPLKNWYIVRRRLILDIF